MPPKRLSPGVAITRGMFAGVIVALAVLAAIAAIGSANAFIAASAYLRMLYGFLAVWAIMAAMQRAAGDPGWWLTITAWLLAVAAVGLGVVAAIASDKDLVTPAPEVQTDVWGLLVAAAWAQACGATVGAFIKHNGDSVFEWIAETAGRR